MNAKLQIAARRIVVVRYHPAQVGGDDLVAPPGEEFLRLEEVAIGFLDARDFRRADSGGGHACSDSITRGNLEPEARSAARAACDPPHDPKRTDSGQASRRRS